MKMKFKILILSAPNRLGDKIKWQKRWNVIDIKWLLLVSFILFFFLVSDGMVHHLHLHITVYMNTKQSQIIIIKDLKFEMLLNCTTSQAYNYDKIWNYTHFSLLHIWIEWIKWLTMNAWWMIWEKHRKKKKEKE